MRIIESRTPGVPGSPEKRMAVGASGTGAMFYPPKYGRAASRPAPGVTRAGVSAQGLGNQGWLGLVGPFFIKNKMKPADLRYAIDHLRAQGAGDGGRSFGHAGQASLLRVADLMSGVKASQSRFKQDFRLRPSRRWDRRRGLQAKAVVLAYGHQPPQSKTRWLQAPFWDGSATIMIFGFSNQFQTFPITFLKFMRYEAALGGSRPVKPLFRKDERSNLAVNGAIATGAQKNLKKHLQDFIL